jgi:hypothetical protein
MNAKAIQLSAAVALGLGITFTSLDAAAAMNAPQAKLHRVESVSLPGAQTKVIHLGTVYVTRADAEGAKPRQPKSYGTVYLGTVHVTEADSLEARAAAKASQQKGASTVTPADSTDVRYAVRDVKEQPGTVFLGTVYVHAKSRRLPVIGTLLAAMDSTSSKGLLAAVGTLVFTLAGG